MSSCTKNTPAKGSAKVEQLLSLQYFGAAPLIPGEDTEAYNQLLVSAVSALKPDDLIEMMWVRDVVDLEWEIRRARRGKVRLASKPDAPRELRFDSFGEDADGLFALAAVEKISPLERLDRLISFKESRRNRAIHELRQYQETEAVRRRIASEVIDGEFCAVPEGSDR